MANPDLINQALALQGASFRVPTLEEAQAQAAQFGGTPMAGPEASFLEQAASAQGLPTGGVSPAFTMVPRSDAGPQVFRDADPAPAPPAALTRRPEPAGQPAPSSQPAPARTTVQGGYGGTNPVPGMLKEATARRTEAEAEMKRQEGIGDYATAEQQQAAADLGAARAATAEDIARVQERSALEGQTYQDRLAADQDSYERATAKAESEQRDISKFISEYKPTDRRSTAKKVMGAVAVGLAALGDQANLAAGLNIGLNVQTNAAANTMQMIQRGIDRDLEQQRMMLDNKRTALAAKNTELGQARERFGDRMDAMKLARAMKLDQAAQEVEALKARGMAPEHMAVADQTIAALSAERANTLMGVSQQRFQQHFQDEQRLKLTQFQQQQAAARARQPMSQKEALELEGKALDNAKKRAELEGGLQKPLTAEQQQKRDFLKGFDVDAQRIATSIASGESVSGGFARSLPGAIRDTNRLKTEASENAMLEAEARIDSGASISEGDLASKRAGLGLDSSDPAVRAEGRRKLLIRYNAKREGLGLPPIEPIVRRGAAR